MKNNNQLKKQIISYHRMVGTVIGMSVTVLADPHFKVNGWTSQITVWADQILSLGLF